MALRPVHVEILLSPAGPFDERDRGGLQLRRGRHDGRRECELSDEGEMCVATLSALRLVPTVSVIFASGVKTWHLPFRTVTQFVPNMGTQTGPVARPFSEIRNVGFCCLLRSMSMCDTTKSVW